MQDDYYMRDPSDGTPGGGLTGFPGGFPGGGPGGFPGGGPGGFPGGGPGGFPGGGPGGFPGGGPGGFPGGGPGGFPGGGPGGFSGGGPGGSQGGPPSGPPPTFVPAQAAAQHTFGALAVNPGSIRPCLFRYTYIWLDNGEQFWAWPVFIAFRTLSGWRWIGFRWVFFGVDTRRIASFICY